MNSKGETCRLNGFRDCFLGFRDTSCYTLTSGELDSCYPVTASTAWMGLPRKHLGKGTKVHGRCGKQRSWKHTISLKA